MKDQEKKVAEKLVKEIEGSTDPEKCQKWADCYRTFILAVSESRREHLFDD